MSRQNAVKPGRAFGVAVVLVVAAAAGVAAGVRWHSTIARLLGGNEVERASPAAQPGAKQLWTCSMHPQVIREEPGLCPICHMQLVPRNAAAGEQAGAVQIDPAVVQNMGVRTAVAERGAVAATIHAAGTLAEREPDQSEISLRVSGWIERLYANTDGMAIKKGEPLFDLFSPELSLAIEDLIAVRKERGRPEAGDDAAGRSTDSLLASAKAKLVFLGLTPEQAEQLGALDAAPRIVTFISPRSGHVRDKAALSAGSAVRNGDRVLRIVDPSVLWLEIRVYERDLGRVRVGQRVEATVDAYPGQQVSGVVSFIHPHLDAAARAGVVRVNIDNEDQRLREGMYASARIQTDAGEETVLTPREAVIDTGERQVVCVAAGPGKFEARDVRMGAQGDDGRVQILSGLAAGEQVVVSGQFLLDSESRMREAVRKFAAVGTTETVIRPPSNPLPPVSPMLASRIDAVYSAYLILSASLGKMEESDTPLDSAALVAAAKAMQSAAVGEEDRALASAVAEGARGMAGKSLAQQREAFKALGDAMVKLADARPPSARVTPKLFAMYCPMAKGSWLQTNDTIANPFYAREMKECGDVPREIRTRATEGLGGPR